MPEYRRPTFSPEDCERLVFLAARQFHADQRLPSDESLELQILAIRLCDALYATREALDG